MKRINLNRITLPSRYCQILCFLTWKNWKRCFKKSPNLICRNLRVRKLIISFVQTIDKTRISSCEGLIPPRYKCIYIKVQFFDNIFQFISRKIVQLFIISVFFLHVTLQKFTGNVKMQQINRRRLCMMLGTRSYSE